MSADRAGDPSAHPSFLKTLDRRTQARVLAEETRRRASGAWGDWERMSFPQGTVGKTGWPSKVMCAHRNAVFCVLDRMTWMQARHLAVSSMSGVRPTFHEMQRIKNEIAGLDCTAVEVYPPHRELVDDADMFHIWVVPPLAFGLMNRGEE